MDSQWTGKHDVQHDLFKAQESIPENIHNALNTKPPEHYVFEDELEHIGSCEGADFRSGPDLELIHQMLHLVKDVNIHTDISHSTENVIEISKMSSKHIQTNVNVATDNCKDIEISFKKKKQRNVAIASLLEGLSNKNILNVEDNGIGHVKLLKPEDFITKPESSRISEANIECNIPMKSVITEASAFVFNRKSPEMLRDDNESPKTELRKSDAYQPSSMAELYYKKYLERSKFKERLQKSTEHVYEKIKSNKDFSGAQLPYHRHMLLDDCIVCNVICRKLFE